MVCVRRRFTRLLDLWSKKKLERDAGFRATAHKVSKSEFSLKEKKGKLSLKLEPRFRNTNFQADSGGRSIQELNGITESQRREN